MNIKVIASGSGGNAYIVSDGVTSLLLDAGVPIDRIRKACGFKLHLVAACLITHEHGDHAKAAQNVAKAGVDVYATSGTIDACGLIGHRIKDIQAHCPFGVGTFTVYPFDVQHDAAEPVGFLIDSWKTGERVLYATDTYYIKYRFDGMTHVMIECNYDQNIINHRVRDGSLSVDLAKRIVKSHMSLDAVIGFLRANDLSSVRQVYLLHLSSDNSDAERFKRDVQRVTGAEVYIA